MMIDNDNPSHETQTELLTGLSEAELEVPPMQKLFVTGNILPGTDVSPERLRQIVDDLTEVTGMNLFGEPQIKTPDHYDQQTFDDLGRAPEDINVSWMWDDSGGQFYIFPDRAHWATVDLHTCKEFDPRMALDYLMRALNFRENMVFSEQTHALNAPWQPVIEQATLPEAQVVGELETILGTDITDTERAIDAGERLEAIVQRALEEGWGERLAALFTLDNRERMRDVHSAFEIAVDGEMMDGVLNGTITSAAEYPFQDIYDRLAVMEADVAGLSPTDRVMHIGTGWPGTAIGLHQKHGNPVTCVEIDPEVVDKSRAALERLGLYGDDKISVVEADGRGMNPLAHWTKAVIISAMVPTADKLAILENIRDLSERTGEVSVILRQPAQTAHSLFYQPLPPQQVFDPMQLHASERENLGRYQSGYSNYAGVRVSEIGRTDPQIIDPLQSIVVHVLRRALRGSNDDRFMIAAQDRMAAV